MDRPFEKTAPTPTGFQIPTDPVRAVGKYRLVRLIGKGGMGFVHKAEDPKLSRCVALKTMQPEFARNEKSCEMFLREARTAAAVRHERVVTIYDCDEADGVPYIAMELLAGMTLRSYLEWKPAPSQAFALRVAHQIAEGLHAAHTHPKRVIHRDIKPENVWLTTNPKGLDVKLLDFGLGRPLVDDTLSDPNVGGKPLGTPLYMSPEHWEGKGIDAQSDLFSLGVIFYEMLVGRRPFPGNTHFEIMTKVCSDKPPRPPDAAGCPTRAEAARIALALLERTKARRTKTAGDAVQALAAILPPPGGGPDDSVVAELNAVRPRFKFVDSWPAVEATLLGLRTRYPNDPRVCHALGDFYNASGGRRERALEAYEQGRACDPCDPVSHFKIGRQRLVMDESDRDAAAGIELALELGLDGTYRNLANDSLAKLHGGG